MAFRRYACDAIDRNSRRTARSIPSSRATRLLAHRCDMFLSEISAAATFHGHFAFIIGHYARAQGFPCASRQATFSRHMRRRARRYARAGAGRLEYYHAFTGFSRAPKAWHMRRCRSPADTYWKATPFTAFLGATRRRNKSRAESRKRLRRQPGFSRCWRRIAAASHARRHAARHAGAPGR